MRSGCVRDTTMAGRACSPRIFGASEFGSRTSMMSTFRRWLWR